MTSTINIAEMTAAFTAQLEAQREPLLTRLADLDTERSGLTVQLAEIDQAVARIQGKPVKPEGATPGTRKPMSEAGKENIRKALQARRERLAAEAAGKVAEVAAVPPSATSEPEAPAEGSEPEPEVKLTALEWDVLVGGLLMNNFSSFDDTDAHNGVWSEQLITNGRTAKVQPKQLSGVVTSLIKKGLATSDGEAVVLTKAGVARARKEAANA